MQPKFTLGIDAIRTSRLALRIGKQMLKPITFDWQADEAWLLESFTRHWLCKIHLMSFWSKFSKFDSHQDNHMVYICHWQFAKAGRATGHYCLCMIAPISPVSSSWASQLYRTEDESKGMCRSWTSDVGVGEIAMSVLHWSESMATSQALIWLLHN